MITNQSHENRHGKPGASEPASEGKSPPRYCLRFILQNTLKPGRTGDPVGSPPPLIVRYLTMLFGTGLGTGYAPAAQGTISSALFVILWLVFVPANLLAELVVVLVLHLAGVPLANWGERMWGKDPGRITIDEWAGQAVALTGVKRRPLPVLIAFLLFRLFDSLKPSFIKRRIETLPGGWGVTLDDTAAGLLARVFLPVCLRICSFRNNSNQRVRPAGPNSV